MRRIPFYSDFLTTPVIPELYWDVHSSEQRWLQIAKELHKLSMYCDELADNVNANSDGIESLDGRIVVLKRRLEELSRKIDAERQGGRSRSPISGEYINTGAALKELVDALRINGYTFADFAALGKTYDEVANTGVTYLTMENEGRIIFGDDAEEYVAPTTTFDLEVRGFGY